MVTTRQPSERRDLALRLSLATFEASLIRQNSALDFGDTAYRQPRCWCQKQPLTSITARCLGRTMSGRPGNPRTCSRNLSPLAWRYRRTIISGRVFAPRIPDIILLRVATSTTSAIGVTTPALVQAGGGDPEVHPRGQRGREPSTARLRTQSELRLNFQTVYTPAYPRLVSRIDPYCSDRN